MEIRNRSTGVVITDSQLKDDNPQTSFPKQITTELLDSYGYDPVLNGPAATVTGPYETSVRDGVEEVDGQWFTKFVVGPIFTDTTDEEGNVTTAAENEAAYRAKIDDQAAKAIRQERGEKLTKCDWTMLSDSPLSDDAKTEWQAYRQALRDITTDSGFPHSVTWPTEPS